MTQQEQNITTLQNILFDRADKNDIKICVHHEKEYEHPDTANIGTIEVKNIDKKPILINIVPWIIPVQMLENHPLNNEQIEKYLKGIDNIIAQKEKEEIQSWVINHTEECGFFQYTPWYFLNGWRYDKEKDTYVTFPYQKDENFYLYSFTLIGPKKLSQADYMIIREMIPSGCRDHLIHNLRGLLNETK